MGKQSTSNIGFKKQIWDAACVLRGKINASEDMSLVLGLIFSKYISTVLRPNIRSFLLPVKVMRKIGMKIPMKIFSSYLLLPNGLA